MQRFLQAAVAVGEVRPRLFRLVLFFADFYFRDSYFSAEIGQISLMSDAFRSTLGRRAFSVAGPVAWNALPDDPRDPSLSADIFRKG